MEKLDRVRRVATRWGIKAGWVKDQPDLHTFGIDVAEQRGLRQSPPTEVHRALYSHGKRPAHKWAHYLEDAHTSYWNEWDGGYRRHGTAIEMAKSLVDDLHACCPHGGSGSKAHEDVGSVHFHDSVIVIEKHRRQRPGQMSSEGGKEP